MVLSVKYSAISGSGKSVNSIGLLINGVAVAVLAGERRRAVVFHRQLPDLEFLGGNRLL